MTAHRFEVHARLNDTLVFPKLADEMDKRFAKSIDKEVKKEVWGMAHNVYIATSPIKLSLSRLGFVR